jgi:hypothetical protein
MGYEPDHWHDLFVMLGGASAALAGLVFVGLSLHSRQVARDRLYRMRARNLTAGIVYVTIVSALVLIPGQPLWLLGVELIVGGLALASLFAEPWVRFNERYDRDLRVRTALADVACLFSVAGGVSLIAESGGGFYLLVPAAIVGVVMNVFGAWSLLLGLAREA